jgi:hypothetical protein
MDDLARPSNVDPALDPDDPGDEAGLGDAAKGKDDADFMELGSDL